MVGRLRPSMQRGSARGGCPSPAADLAAGCDWP